MKHMKKLLLALSLVVAGSLHAHSDAFKPAFVDTLVQPYLQIQKGLASDDLQLAQVGAKHFLAAMKKAPHEGEAHEEAMDLSQPAKQIVEVSDISTARTAFLELSREMTSLVKHIGVTDDTPLYLAHCPMAFGNKGGSWLQSEKTVSNPYYGSMMLRCGSVKNQLAGKKYQGHSTHGAHGSSGGHSGHKH